MTDSSSPTAAAPSAPGRQADQPLAAQRRRRFYTSVAVQPDPEGQGQVLVLDGRPVHTPGRRRLVLPRPGLAAAVAAEWEAQGETIDPISMPQTQLANTALDRVAPDTGPMVEALVAYGGSDLVCYRATGPQALEERQERAWSPLLDWLSHRHGAPLDITRGIMPLAQPPESLARLAAVLAAMDPWHLTGVQAITAAAGSLVLALAVADRRVSAEEAFALAWLDETWQADVWGEVEEARERRERIAAEVAAAARFLRLLEGDPA